MDNGAWARKGQMRLHHKNSFHFSIKTNKMNNKFIWHFLCHSPLSLVFFLFCSAVNAERAVATSSCEWWQDIARSWNHSNVSSSLISIFTSCLSLLRPTNRRPAKPGTFVAVVYAWMRFVLIDARQRTMDSSGVRLLLLFLLNVTVLHGTLGARNAYDRKGRLYWQISPSHVWWSSREINTHLMRNFGCRIWIHHEIQHASDECNGCTFCWTITTTTKNRKELSRGKNWRAPQSHIYIFVIWRCQGWIDCLLRALMKCKFGWTVGEHSLARVPFPWAPYYVSKQFCQQQWLNYLWWEKYIDSRAARTEVKEE